MNNTAMLCNTMNRKNSMLCSVFFEAMFKQREIADDKSNSNRVRLEAERQWGIFNNLRVKVNNQLINEE